MQHFDNIRRVLDRADAIDRTEGAEAYFTNSATLEALGAFYGVSKAATVGAFSALSPNNGFVENLRSVASVLDGYRRGLPPTEIVVSTYNACKDRAWRVVAGGEDFLSFTKGPKTRAFYLNTLDPFDPEPVTIDGHMVSIWFAKRLRMMEAVRMKWSYEEIAGAVREIAAERGMIPNQVQSICWHTWKRIHNVKFQAQTSLFDGAGLGILRPGDIRPFRRK
jgi:hypothetical protein